METKHTTFFEGLRDLPEPWGLGTRPVPPPPKFGGNVTAVSSLTKFLGVSSSHITYVYRHDFPDDSQYDDRIIVIFRPSKVDLRCLIYTVLPTYIQAFDAYRVEWFDDELVPIVALAPPPKTRQNKRCSVRRVGPISFFDDLLCQRAFRLHASAVVDLFNGRIEHAEIVHDGAYLVGSSHVLSFQESEQLAREMQQRLTSR